MINKNKYSWEKYNLNKIKIIKKNIEYNKKHKFNAIENSYYPHTRDIFCLAIKSSEIVKILDFGSNQSILSNLKNKINTKRKYFVIYDPFFKKGKEIKFRDISYKIVKKLGDLNNLKFDFLHFGSSLQYIDDYNYIFDFANFTSISKILFTATPFNLNKKYMAKQSNHRNLLQYVHNFRKLKLILKKKKFTVTFQSCMDIKLAELNLIKKNTFFMNVLFEKNEKNNSKNI